MKSNSTSQSCISQVEINKNLTPCARIIGNLLIWFQNNCAETYVSLEWLAERTNYSIRHIRRTINEELAPMGFVSVKVRRQERTTNLFKVSELFFLPEFRAKFAHIWSNLRTLGMNVLFNNVRLINSKFREYIKNLGYLGLCLCTKTMNLNSQSTKKIVNLQIDSKNPKSLNMKAAQMQNEINSAEILQHINPTITEVSKRFHLTLAGKIFLTQFPEHILQLAYKATKGKTGHFGYFVTVCKNSCNVRQIEPNWKLKVDLMKKANLPKDAPHTEPQNTQIPVFQEKNNLNKMQGEEFETAQDQNGSFSAPNNADPNAFAAELRNNSACPQSLDKWTTNIEYNPDGTYTRPSWNKTEKIPLTPVHNLPISSKLSHYTIQQLADEMKNWQKILDGYLKEAKIVISEPNLAKYISTDEKIAFVTSQIKVHMAEFTSRPPEEQSQAK